MKQSSNSQRTVRQALEILLAFTPHNQDLGTSELSRKLEIHKSTVSRLLRVLKEYGFLQRDPNTRKYRLGNSAAQIGRAVIQSVNDHLVSIAQPYMDELRNSIGETVVLEVMSGHSTVLSCKSPGSQFVQVSMNIGDRLPAHVAAGSKAILAFSSPEFVDKLLVSKLARFTPNTITDPIALKGQLAEFRELGIAFDRGENDIDVYAVAAPVFTHDKRPVAAVVITTPSNRKDFISKSKVISSLKGTAASISERLLYTDKED